MTSAVRRQMAGLARNARLLDTRGAAATEFALLAPLFIMMIFGIMQVGVWLQNYNAVQSIASDGARYVMIEYQKENNLTDEQVRLVILGQATNAPYLLDTDRINITVDRAISTTVLGATQINIAISYRMPEFIPFVDIPLFSVDYSRSVWVVAT